MTVKVVIPWRYDMTFYRVQEIEKLKSGGIKLIFRTDEHKRLHSVSFPKNRTENNFEYFILGKEK